MRRAGLVFGLVAMMVAPYAMAGDASGFDPDAIGQCLAAAASQGDRADCADAGMTACLDFAGDRYTGADMDFPQMNCLDAAHQAWETRLSDIYQQLLAQEAAFGIKPSEMLRQTEYAWIGFRDDLCNWTREAANARGENGDLVQSRCRRDEAARHWALLSGWLDPDAP